MPERSGATALLGRDRELRVLGETLRTVAEGQPSVVVVTGEAGVGKTSLLRLALGSVPAIVLTGNCIPIAGEGMAFAPVMQALRDRSPNFPAAIPWAGPTSDDDVPLSSSSQVRLFESVLSQLFDPAPSDPIVLVIEDIHWADRSTLDLVAFLVRNVRTQPLLLVLSVRSDDLPRRHPLRSWLAELDRLPHVTRLTVHRLGILDTAAQMQVLLDREPEPELVTMVHERSAGNPLFTELLMPWVGDPGRQLPETLRDLVGARLAALPDPTRRMLEVASVIGRTCPLDLLSSVAHESAEAVEEALRAAVDRQLVEPGSATDYSFSHPLVREILEADLLPGERRRLHAEAARELARVPAQDPHEQFALAGRIARHWDVAGVPDLAFVAAVRAGLAAGQVFAFAESDEYLTRALALRSRVGTDVFADLPIDPAELVAQASQAAHLVGDGIRAVRLTAEAIELSADPAQRSRILERRGAYCFYAGLADEASAAYQGALDLLPAEPESAARARVFAGLAMLAMGWSRMDEAQQHCQEAIRIARAVGATREEGRAQNALGVICAHRGEFTEGIEHSRSALRIASELADPDELALAYIDLAHVLGLAGHFDEAVDACREGYEELARVGLVRQSGSFLQANAAESLVKSGRWAEAEEVLTAARGRLSGGLLAWPPLAISARLALGRGDLPQAQAYLHRAQTVIDGGGAPDPWVRLMIELEAELSLEQARPDEARAKALAGLDLVQGTDEEAFAGQLVGLAARAVADQAETARARRSVTAESAALDALDRLIERAGALVPDPLDGPAHSVLAGGATASTIAAELLRGRAGPGPGQADAWAVAAAAWRDVGQPLPEAYCCFREAEALVLSKQTGERVVSAVRRAHDAASSLGAAAIATEAEHLARWGRIELGGDPTTSLPGQEGAVLELGLTPREVEVLEGLVAGRTNREIAESHFISVKTASVHVSNILRKLGVAHREEAARVAHRLGVGRH